MGCRRPAGVRRTLEVGGGGGRGLGKMAGASWGGGGGHLRAGPSHLPPRSPALGAGRGQVETGAPGTSRVFLPSRAATHPRNIEEADSGLREDLLLLGSPGKWSSTDAHSLPTRPLPAVFSGEPLCTSLRRLRIERICDPEARSPARFGLASATKARPSLYRADLALGGPLRQKDC